MCRFRVKIYKQALQPFLDELQKDFADMLTALVQELVADARAGESFSTGRTAPAASPAAHTPASQ